MNFIDPTVRRKQKAYRRWLWISCCSCVFLSSIFVGFSVWHMHYLNILRIQKAVLVEQEVSLDGSIAAAREWIDIASHKGKCTDCIVTIANSIPVNVCLDSLLFDKGNDLTIVGSCNYVSCATTFLRKLLEHDCFSDLVITGFNTRQFDEVSEDSGGGKYIFEIKGLLVSCKK